MPNKNNWRVHPSSQVKLFQDILDDIGFADVVLAYESQREGGKLVLVDGHMRAGLLQDEIIPTIILDISDEEADTLLMTLDPLGSMAEVAKDKASALLSNLNVDIKDQLSNVPDLEGLIQETLKKNPVRDNAEGKYRRPFICPHCGEEIEF